MRSPSYNKESRPATLKSPTITSKSVAQKKRRQTEKVARKKELECQKKKHQLDKKVDETNETRVRSDSLRDPFCDFF